MNFDWSASQQALAAQVAALFGRFPAADKLRAWADAGIAAFDADLWRMLAEQGWLGSTTSPIRGGLGWEELALLAYEAGRALAPVPLTATLLAGEAFAQVGAAGERADLVGGALRAAVYLPPPGLGPVLEVRRGRARGVLAPVADGLVADWLLCVDADDAAWLVDLRGAGPQRRALATLDLAHTAARVTLDGVSAVALGAAAPWRDRAAILYAFEQLGGGQRCLDLAVDYAKERYAFGQPIGAFQAVKHRLAELHVEIELARANAYYGAFALTEGAPDQLGEAAALARASATDCYLLVAKESLHLHGAVGFTWACEAHLHLRRATALQADLGSAALWCERLVETPVGA